MTVEQFLEDYEGVEDLETFEHDPRWIEREE